MTDVDDIGGKPPLGALFSTAASDNAEVVPPSAPRGPESMWSTEAAAPPPGIAADDEPAVRADSTFVTGEPPPAQEWAYVDDAHDDARPLWDRDDIIEEGPFSAEPVSRDDDVIDAGDLFDPLHDETSAWTRPTGSGSVFSSGRAAHVATPPPVDDSPWTVLADDWDDPEATSLRADTGTRSRRAEPRHDGPRHGEPRRHESRHDEPWDEPWHDDRRPAGQAPPRWTQQPSDPAPSGQAEPTSDPHGLEAAVARLSPHDQERAAVAIAVCGALLEPDELVAGVVTGQMLGRPAAVAVTDRRVIIANDRRWQPLVDVYRIDSKLVVRGRHDRQVAALSFADTTRLSMIDGITEVELAIELAERIRDSDPLD